MAYFDKNSLENSLERLHGTAHHLLKIWFALKQMGMREDHAVEVTTSSPTPALKRLFSYGDPEGKFFVPFAHTSRFKTMKGDAARSIIQTTIQRWFSSGSVVEVDPTNFLNIEELESGTLVVKPKRGYPRGLGWGKNGFALEDNSRVCIPDLSFCVWYFRQTDLGTEELVREKLIAKLMRELSLSPAEIDLIFVSDEWNPLTQNKPLTDKELFDTIASKGIDLGLPEKILDQPFAEHLAKLRSMTTITPGPGWLTRDAQGRFKAALEDGCKAILLYGPPRTSKTFVIDQVIPRDSKERVTIQIHDGWGYEDLMMGLRPTNSDWAYHEGPLLKAIRAGKKYIVLEEINRTDFSQAIGDTFSLIEEAYRGKANSITLKDGTEFYIPEDTVIICTMNTLDRSTQDIDDALFGRMTAIEFVPRVEDLHSLLSGNKVSAELSEKLRGLFATILEYYPLGHGYFADFTTSTQPVDFYLTKIRPVLQKHLQNFRDDDLKIIDEKVDSLFT